MLYQSYLVATLASSISVSPMGDSYEGKNFKSTNETAEFNTNVVTEERINVDELRNDITEEKKYCGKFY